MPFVESCEFADRFPHRRRERTTTAALSAATYADPQRSIVDLARRHLVLAACGLLAVVMFFA